MNKEKLCHAVNYFLGEKVVCNRVKDHAGMCTDDKTTWTGRNHYMSEGERAIFAAVYAAKYMDALKDRVPSRLATVLAWDCASTAIKDGRTCTSELDENDEHDDGSIAMMKDMF